ncbi:MAG TPA: hypothetical protein VMF13_22750 [Luteitalea sp.]|nr:hypothetical protein [Luteitalea sp.]
MPGIWETDAEWRRLKRELTAWRVHRAAGDPDGQHRSQLEGCVTLIDGALDELHAPIAALTTADPRLAEHCRTHDRRLVWLRRVWQFFRDRFDQRDDAGLAPTLGAADEVVWSCHRAAFATPALGMVASSGPPPLPYVEPQLTPEVFPHGLVPGDLRRDVDATFLRTWLQALPFAIVRLPASCVTAPWWLVHLGHEVGHVIDHQCLGYQARVAIVDDLALDEPSADEWRRWSVETFADAYAILTFGGWALWALARAEARDDAAMLTPRDAYPSPAVRLLVMAHACQTLGVSIAAAQPIVDRCQALVEGDPTQVTRLRAGTRVVDALLATPVNKQTWRARTAHDPGRWSSQNLRAWVKRLPGRPAAVAGRARREWAREVLAAGVLRRWRAETDATFDGDALAADLHAWLPAVRETGARSLATTGVAHSTPQTLGAPKPSGEGGTLAQLLITAEPLG